MPQMDLDPLSPKVIAKYLRSQGYIQRAQPQQRRSNQKIEHAWFQKGVQRPLFH